MLLRCPQGICSSVWTKSKDDVLARAKHGSHTFPLRMMVSRVTLSATTPPRLSAYVGRYLKGQ